MKHTLEFTGNFKNLKEMGYKFMKLYANNYKVYNKKLPQSFNIWVWVGNGGYIEINDLYSNTKNFIDAVKSIDWNTIQERTGVILKGTYKRMFVRLNHSHPERGYQINGTSIELETIMSMPKEIREGKVDDNYFKHYDIAYAKTTETFDREMVVWEETSKELLEELEKINKL